MNWLGYKVERDPFGKLLLKASVTRKQIKDWSVDPQVTYGPLPITKSLFDSLEDTDSDYCLALCQMIAGACQPKGEQDDTKTESEIAKLKAQIESYKDLEKAVMTIQAYTAPRAAKKKAKAKAKIEKEEEPEEKPS